MSSQETTIEMIKKITNEKELTAIAKQLIPTLKQQLKTVSETLEKLSYAATEGDNNLRDLGVINENYGQYRDLKKEIDDFRGDELSENVE